MTTIKTNYKGDLKLGLEIFLAGIKITEFDKGYNSMCLNVINQKGEIYQVDRAYGAPLAEVDLESEFDGMVYEMIDEHFNGFYETNPGEYEIELMKYEGRNNIDREISNIYES